MIKEMEKNIKIYLGLSHH